MGAGEAMMTGVTVQVLLRGAVRPVGLVIGHSRGHLVLERVRRLLVQPDLRLERGQLLVKVRVGVPRVRVDEGGEQAARDQHG